MTTTNNNQDFLHKYTVGYMVNALISEKIHYDVYHVQHAFSTAFPDVVWATPANALHMTVMQLLAPQVNYGEDKDALFEKVFPTYDPVLHQVFRHVAPFEITFDRLFVSESAIALYGDDKSNALFNEIRQKFLSQIELPPHTDLPPNIAHSTIIRFVGEIPLEDVQKVADSLQFSITQSIDEFRVVRETELPMLNYSVVKTYPLSY
jgi:hypothetical protein